MGRSTDRHLALCVLVDAEVLEDGSDGVGVGDLADEASSTLARPRLVQALRLRAHPRVRQFQSTNPLVAMSSPLPS